MLIEGLFGQTPDGRIGDSIERGKPVVSQREAGFGEIDNELGSSRDV